MSVHSDRNLLVGILALQMDFIDRDQLIAAMSDWVNRKKVPLDEILVAQGAMAPDVHALMLALVEKHLHLHDEDPQKSLAAISSVDADVRSQLRSVADSEVEASLGALSPTDVSRAESTAGIEATLEFAPADSGKGRFRILRPHARGGLGEVFVARDQELNREVALKEIRDAYADHEDSRARFLAEAEITGGLEHPGIVPVYGLGTYSNGRPFYAMRFIRGDSLKEAADRFFDRSGGHPKLFDSVDFRKLLGRLVDVCNAIAYAHSRGVLHRDLKPGNIMLGKYGETLVVDWGLSKSVGRGEKDRFLDEPTLHPSANSGSVATQLGSALGTPQYMPPEQAAGKLDQLGPKSDVYSLGATLYYLLTGRPPFKDKDTGRLLQAVQSGEFPPPRRLKQLGKHDSELEVQKSASDFATGQSIPPPLEAVCLKAMSLDPHDRHESAGELAEDIERFLADEPVSCYPEPWRHRVGRFARKHQSAVAATLIFLVCLTLGGIIVSSVTSVSNAKLRTARSNLESRSEELARVNMKLGTTNQDLESTLAEVAAAKSDAESKQALAEKRLALAFFERGINHARRGGPDVGLLWMNRARQVLPANAQDLDSAIAYGMKLWNARCLSLTGVAAHKSAVTVVQFSDDGRRLLTASFDRTARLWNVDDMKPIGPELKHSHQIEAAILRSDGKTIITGTYDGILQVFDGESGEVLGENEVGSLIREIQLNGDESVAVLRTNSGGLFPFDPNTGELSDHPELEKSVSAFSLHPRKKLLAVSNFREKFVGIYDLQARSFVETQIKLSAGARLVRFSPDGNSLIVVADQPQIFDAETLEPTSGILPQRGVRGINFHPSGSKFVTAGIDGRALTYSLPDGKLAANPITPNAQVFQAKFDSSGKLILTSASKVAQLWDATTGRRVGQPLRDAGRIAFSPDGKRLATASFNNLVRIWGLPANSSSPLLEMDGYVRSTAVSDTGTTAMLGGQGSYLTILKQETDQPPTVIKVPVASTVGSVCIASDEKRLAAGTWKNGVVLLDAQGQVVNDKMPHEAPIHAVQFTPDGKILISSDDAGVLKRWKADSGQVVGKPVESGFPIRAMAVNRHPDSGHVIALITGFSEAVELWDLDDQVRLHQLVFEESRPDSAVCFADQGKILITSYAGRVVAWNTVSGEQIWAVGGGGRSLTCLKLIDKGQRLLTASYDGTLHVLNVESGIKFGKVVRHESPIIAACYDPKSGIVITGDDDGLVKTTHLTTGVEIAARQRHVGDITVAEVLAPGRVLVGHASIHEYQLGGSSIDDTNAERSATLEHQTAIRLDDDGVIQILDEESLGLKESQNSAAIAAYFKVGTRPLISLTQPLDLKSGPFGKAHLSATVKRDP